MAQFLPGMITSNCPTQEKTGLDRTCLVTDREVGVAVKWGFFYWYQWVILLPLWWSVQPIQIHRVRLSTVLSWPTAALNHSMTGWLSALHRGGSSDSLEGWVCREVVPVAACLVPKKSHSYMAAWPREGGEPGSHSWQLGAHTCQPFENDGLSKLITP